VVVPDVTNAMRIEEGEEVGHATKSRVADRSMAVGVHRLFGTALDRSDDTLDLSGPTLDYSGGILHASEGPLEPERRAEEPNQIAIPPEEQPMTTGVTVRAGREDWGKLLLRLTVGVLLLFHGVAKLGGGIGWMAGPLSAIGLPAFVGYGVFIGEIVAPILAIVGKFSRIAGLVIAFNMLAAILLVRRGAILSTNEQGGGWAIELEMLFLLGGVAIFLLGSGRYAISKGRGRWD
jgi:putative oxidoreductase